jgi:peptide-methionine (S)-S-oxide reductase
VLEAPMRRLTYGFVTALVLSTGWSAAAASESLVPPPRLDPPASGRQVAILAGGCFWGMEAVFERLKGVDSVVSGYAGGARKDANYARVSSERTGHAEVVRISFDPKVVSYGTLLRVYFSVAHDPTQLNRQGPDVGPSYRSSIFPQSQRQEQVARAYLAQLAGARSFPRPIVTRIERGPFFAAEPYHQDFMRRNPRHPYILAHDVPKVRALQRLMPRLVKA